MSDHVPAEDIEAIVGQERHSVVHYGRAVSGEGTVYILHSYQCRDSGIDLRECEYSIALDHGIDAGQWRGFEDEAVALYIDEPGVGRWLRPLGKPRPPQRVQRKRTKGWRAPALAVYVGRGSKWGNLYAMWKFRDGLGEDAYKVYEPEKGLMHTFFGTDAGDRATARELAAAKAVELYRTHWLPTADHEALRAALAGRDLMCWCPLDQPCHADVLLELANQAPS